MSGYDRDVPTFYYSESEDEGTSTATTAHEEHPKGSILPHISQRLDYARLQGYFRNAKHLFSRLEAKSSLENIPLPLFKREIEPGQEWIKGAMLCAWGTALILTLNAILTIIAVGVGYSRSSGDKYFTYTELYEGSCSVTNSWTTAMHFIINMLSTALLAASNYVMQCLVAPSRADVDRAHSRRQWLDIGVLSTRNLAIMDNKRKILWALLFISSFPIHMLYNAAIFSSISTIEYGIVVVPQDLAKSESLVKDEPEARSFSQYVGFTASDIQAEMFNGTFTEKDLLGCIERYDVEYNTKAGTLLLLAARDSLRGFSSLLPLDGAYSAYAYTSTGTSLADAIGFNSAQNMSYLHAGNWNYPGWSFKYKEANTWTDIREFTDYSSWSDSVDYTQHASQHCQFYFSPAICIAVIACNMVKVFCMYLAARTDHKEIFLTVGDALSSFLDRPDPNTKGGDIISGFQSRNRRASALDTININPSHDTDSHLPLPQLLPRRKRWFGAATWKRWASTYTALCACMAVSIYLYYRSAGTRLARSVGSNLGMGNPNSSALFFDGADSILLSLLANTPQLVFSALYLLCNGLFTSILAVAEYNDFANQRKTLRVTWPKGGQRSTYYLSLPYRYSIPLIGVSVFMHWILSQCIFLVKINSFDVHGNRLLNTEDQTTACGWSPLPMFITIVIGGSCMIALLGFGFRRLRSNMPLVSYRSAALSAACHPPPGDEGASLKPVMWGEVRGESLNGTNTEDHGNQYAHCTFTSKEVATPRIFQS
ncbi:hypothetical protein ASPVEDRAFT_891047 [Aspergillus versicolor CBS 583.65]|uniref:DUF6536 domain-containing protein n=1 Tax=Aspergillus versicolor CBS 583.65 TaxID=1036611 RepID=A0A1L9PQV3_ASPVE|nr:uncharacterized protein ASPVEDRAFT_891047 [Aspergillus versicolor CBS 583.65]OJJ03883.1 hypothetical protein ASPVEDRAFT_891047 [Aspergillus versicolor CBS 583.65]